MLTASPKGWPSTVYSLSENNAEIGSFNVKTASHDLFLQGSAYKLQRTGAIKGEYFIESAGKVIAHAKHAGLLSSTIVIEYAGKEYNMKGAGMFSGSFGLFEGGKRVGNLTFNGKNVTADLPQEIPLPVRTFILWLTLLIGLAAAAKR